MIELVRNNLSESKWFQSDLGDLSHYKDYNMILVLVVLLITLFYSESRINIPMGSFPYDGVILNASRGQLFQVDISTVPTGKNYYVTFNIRNPTCLSSAFIAIDTQEDAYKKGDVSLSYFYGKNYSQIQDSIDIAGMQLGKKQYINRIKKSSEIKLYMTVYNIDAQYRRIDIEFTIDLRLSGVGNALECYSCSNYGQRVSSDSCLCNNCAPGYYGPDCSINLLSLTNGQSSTAFINGPAMAFFKIQQSNQINILVKLSSGSGQVYFQFVQFQGQFASYTNVAVGKSVQGRFMVTAGTSGTNIAATSTGTLMSLTVAIFQDINTSAEVSYMVVQKSNILVIVLAVLGGVLFIGLVIAAIYIVRNSNYFQNNNTVHPQTVALQNLNDDQIQRFFPTVLLKNIKKPGQQSSMNQINQNPQKTPLVQDCVICLCPIQLQEQIKVTYCKHIFHSYCLVGWFKKQQNCPYCREEFTRMNTIKLYKKLKEIVGEDELIKGQHLASAILAAKSITLHNKQNVQNQNQTQKIQVGSRQLPQSFSIQNLS